LDECIPCASRPQERIDAVNPGTCRQPKPNPQPMAPLGWRGDELEMRRQAVAVRHWQTVNVKTVDPIPLRLVRVRFREGWQRLQGGYASTRYKPRAQVRQGVQQGRLVTSVGQWELSTSRFFEQRITSAEIIFRYSRVAFVVQRKDAHPFPSFI